VERSILRLEKFLAIVFSAFFILASVVAFGFGLVQALGAFVGSERSIEPLMSSIALVAVAVAVMELGATILSEELARTDPKREAGEIRRTLSRFLYIVITALSIEGLLMVFKYSLRDQPSSLLYAAAVIVAPAILLIAIAVYNRLSLTVEVEEAKNPAVNETSTSPADAPTNH